MGDILKGYRRVVVIGVQTFTAGFLLTGTSGKFVNMTEQAIEEFVTAHGVQFEKITKISLEGEGTIGHRVEKHIVIYCRCHLIATHSQGSVVSTHLLNCLIRDRHIRTVGNSAVVGGGSSILPAPKPQRVCCLAQCGIHLGPLRYLSCNSLLQPYIQNTNSNASEPYVTALENVLTNGVKMVYVTSLHDQVIPIYSGLFTAASHPVSTYPRASLYIDGDAYHGLLAHLLKATAGSLNGVGHSTPYEELATYSYDKCLRSISILTNDGLADHSKLVVELFNTILEQNDYEIPWSLRDIIADERVAHFFRREIIELRDIFREWHPKTAILRDLKRKLQPIQSLPASFSLHTSTSKL
ncbi:hypothetical protein BDQ17DRAFT_1362634 [Cyathus striatus]|nr:hypothetical protein BDQ17DRAFT_1362634 [Cyathus striatus]